MAFEPPYPSDQTPLSGCSCERDGCDKVGYQYADICIPIELKPDTTVGHVTVECCGEPAVNCREHHSGNTCEIVVTQKVNIRIPVRYQVIACMGESVIDCGCDEHCEV